MKQLLISTYLPAPKNYLQYFFSFYSLWIELVHVNDEVYNHNTDEEQGISSWVAANYALGNLGREPPETTGIVEFGGDSLQVFSFTILQFNSCTRESKLVHYCSSLHKYMYNY